MSGISRLSGVPAREAWPHEANNFTPWLAENIDYLADEIGLPLEVEDTEVPVESFSADILARSPYGLVLIENQLEKTDHTHMGQIMTYLAGLEASAIIWIATEFREPHLAAIRWLNEHTVEPFAFFAIRLRVVRIAESPLAPVFDVLERPNNWERRVQAEARDKTTSAESEERLAFWETLLQRHPNALELGFKPARGSNIWLAIDTKFPLVIGMFKSKKKIGIYIRGTFGADSGEVRETLSAYSSRLENRIGVELDSTHDQWYFYKKLEIDTINSSNWPEAADWLYERATTYMSALREALQLEPEVSQ